MVSTQYVFFGALQDLSYLMFNTTTLCLSSVNLTTKDHGILVLALSVPLEGLPNRYILDLFFLIGFILSGFRLT